MFSHVNSNTPSSILAGKVSTAAKKLFKNSKKKPKKTMDRAEAIDQAPSTSLLPPKLVHLLLSGSTRSSRTAVEPPASYPIGVPNNLSSQLITNTNPRVMSFRNLRLVKFVGKGTTGMVYHMSDRLTGLDLAVKVAKKRVPKYTIRGLLSEQATLRALGESPWFVQLEASWADYDNFYIATPLYPTSLDSEILRSGTIEPKRARFYMAELIIALRELHKRGFIHRDIKTENILIDWEGHIVLADFGLAKDFGRPPSFLERAFPPYWPYLSGENVDIDTTPPRDPRELHFVSRRLCGTPLHMAPEIFEGQYYSFGVDYWAAAVTLFIMLTDRAPFLDTFGKDTRALRKIVISGSPLKFLPHEKLDSNTKEFLNRMLVKNPKHRLRIDFDLQSHAYFDGIDWEAMKKRQVPAPWIPGPETPPVITDPEMLPNFIPGSPYEDPMDDPHPEFTYVSEKLQLYSPTEESKPTQDLPERRSWLTTLKSWKPRKPFSLTLLSERFHKSHLKMAAPNPDRRRSFFSTLREEEELPPLQIPTSWSMSSVSCSTFSSVDLDNIDLDGYPGSSKCPGPSSASKLQKQSYTQTIEDLRDRSDAPSQLDPRSLNSKGNRTFHTPDQSMPPACSPAQRKRSISFDTCSRRNRRSKSLGSLPIRTLGTCGRRK